jgi:hypothetical protein
MAIAVEDPLVDICVLDDVRVDPGTTLGGSLR